MDEIDKKIIFNYLKDGRVSQRDISTKLNISPQALNYRVEKLLSIGIIKGFKTYVDERINNKNIGFAAYKNDIPFNDNIFLKITCLEELIVYGFAGKDTINIRNEINKSCYGKPLMEYLPENNLNYNISGNDRLIINELKKDPKIAVRDMESELNLTNAYIKRRINFFKENGILNVLPVIDLSKTDIVLFALFSKKFEKISDQFDDKLILKFSDKYSGIAILFSMDMDNAKKLINKFRLIDNELSIMIIYNYDFYSSNF